MGIWVLAVFYYALSSIKKLSRNWQRMMHSGSVKKILNVIENYTLPNNELMNKHKYPQYPLIWHF